MGSRYRVLIFPGGTEIGLEINSALRYCREVELYAAGTAASNHAPLVFQKYFELPLVSEPHWLDRLVSLITQHHIDFIIPAHDDAILALAASQQFIPARVLTSPLETCRITRSKLRTYEFFREILPVPDVYDDVDEIREYPVFVKPDIGQGSQGAKCITSPKQLSCVIDEYAASGMQPVIMRYLPGTEYTIDCFTHRVQGLLFCEGRERIRTRNGISMASTSVTNPVFLKYANIITKYLTLHGAWFFQVKEDYEGTLVVLEIASRVAGTMAVSRVRGVNFPLLSLYEALEVPLKIQPLQVAVTIDRALANRYTHSIRFRTMYIDWDDTIVINGALNLNAIKLIFQCVNKGIRVVLLTRHAGDLVSQIEKYHLSKVFDEVIHVSGNQEKADFIRDVDAIFVDDSFSERQKVQMQLGISTFDCSMIELLLDDRG